MIQILKYVQLILALPKTKNPTQHFSSFFDCVYQLLVVKKFSFINMNHNILQQDCV